MPIADRLEQVITDLGDTRDDITALLDDIWLDIDHTNPASIKSGSERMISALETAGNFRKAADELTAKLRGFFPASAPAATVTPPTTVSTPQHNLFAASERISLNDSWTYRRPAGFTLQSKQFAFLNTWSSLYLRLLGTLREADPKLFETLPERPEFTSSQNNPYITRDRTKLRDAEKVADSIFAEINLNANLIRDNIRYVLKVFGLKEPDIQIFLRKKP